MKAYQSSRIFLLCTTEPVINAIMKRAFLYPSSPLPSIYEILPRFIHASYVAGRQERMLHIQRNF